MLYIPEKIVLSEEVYNQIKNVTEKAIDDDLSSNYCYSFKAYGSRKKENDLFISNPEENKLFNKDSLYIVNGDDMDLINEHIFAGEDFFATVIFHVKKDTDTEDFLAQYKRSYNFYSPRMKPYPLVVVIDSKTRTFKLEMFEKISSRFIKLDYPIFVRDEKSDDIQIEDYEKQIKSDEKNGIK